MRKIQFLAMKVVSVYNNTIFCIAVTLDDNASTPEVPDCSHQNGPGSSQYCTASVTESKSTQTLPDTNGLRLICENVTLRNELADMTSKLEVQNGLNDATTQRKYFRACDIQNDNEQCKFYTGLTWLQLMSLWDMLGSSKNKLTYWNQILHECERSPEKRPGLKRKLEPFDELFLTLVRLRTGLLNADLAYRFGISKTLVSKIVRTWIQFLFLEFSRFRDAMFPTRGIIARNLPSSFKSFKGVRAIIDCCEFFVEQPRNFAQQGHLYSSYKHHTTFKVLVAIGPTGAVTFVSSAFEGSISDVEIVKQSGFLDKLQPGDLVIADRGFTIKELLAERGVDLNIPPFLKGRRKLTPNEEILTRKIARVRIHVERTIERIKKFRLLNKIIPLSLAPVFSQMVFVAACLVNFQEPLVK